MNVTVRELPRGLEPLTDLALDQRWSTTPAGDTLWERVDHATWQRTGSPWVVLQSLSQERLEHLARDTAFRAELWRLAAEREHDLAQPTWYQRAHPGAALRCVAYFSMEFGLGEALPIYAGGLGILAGDLLKAASDLDVPVVGVGLLYQEGYFRQMVGWTGSQSEVYPYNEPLSLPIQPVLSPDGGLLRVYVDLPGRSLSLRVWRVTVGRVALYLLDSNDPVNAPIDRGITSKLYGGGREMRLLQEMVLGVGGWRALAALGLQVDVCHLNEGHAALATLERIRHYMDATGHCFREALWVTRAGNVFTTHTPIAAGFDAFEAGLVARYLRDLFARPLGLSLDELLALGRRDAADEAEPFNLAYLAVRCSARVNAVSELHRDVSRVIFAGLFRRWPLAEIPVRHVTNGVHVPSWESPHADRLWTAACGRGRWSGDTEVVRCGVEQCSDLELWTFRTESRRALVEYVRERLWQQRRQRGAGADKEAKALDVLDPAVLTIGFARRFAEYKRPHLLLADPDRLARLLVDRDRPVQLVVAGKAHPADDQGKAMVRRWAEFTERRDVRDHAVFLEDYDMVLARNLVGGVDLWVNTPRRPWEACGTSGMKVLANGGLNLSVLDGWWAEAYATECGWTLGAPALRPSGDEAEAAELYRLLEQEVVPAFYERDADGVPPAWVARMRASMTKLAPRFSASRMVRDYVEDFYLPAAQALRRRSHEGARLGCELRGWEAILDRMWDRLRFGGLWATRDDGSWRFEVELFCGDMPASTFRVELYADAGDGETEPFRQPMERGAVIEGAETLGHRYWARVPATRPASAYTARAVPFHPGVQPPGEVARILWQR